MLSRERSNMSVLRLKRWSGSRSVLWSAAVLAFVHQNSLAQNYSVPPAQKCTVTNIKGQPIAGRVCGGTSHALDCTAGALYNCNTNSSTNNCTLAQACARGCLTNGSSGTLNDACFT